MKADVGRQDSRRFPRENSLHRELCFCVDIAKLKVFEVLDHGILFVSCGQSHVRILENDKS